MSKQLWLKNYPVRWNLNYPEVSLYHYLCEKTSQCDQLIALVYDEESITFHKVHDNINRFAAALTDLGVKKGDRVALIMPNCPEYVYAYYACMKVGAIEVQIDPLFTPSEVELALNDSGANTVVIADIVFDSLQAVRDKASIDNIIVNRIVGEESLEKNELCLEELIEKHSPLLEETVINPKEDIAVLQYTSGTTGIPKAVMLTHYNLVCNIEQKREWFKDWFDSNFANGVTQKYGLAIMPFFHCTGMNTVMNFGLTFPLGLLILPSFDVETTLELIDQYRPVYFMGVPTIFNAIANHPNAARYNVRSIDIFRTGGAPMPVNVIEDIEAKTGVKIVEGYGLTEASPTTHANPYKSIRKFGSIGLPYPDTECLIVDPEKGIDVLPPDKEGELIVKGPQIMKGYWNRPEETSKTLRNGWLYTGDIAKMDSGGYFYIVDRKKDMVITGGINIYPSEVDEVITDHPKVAEAISIGIPDDYFGEVLKSYIVPKNGENLGENELLDFCARKLAIYKLPSIIEFRQALPKNNTGKLLRRVLMEEEVNKGPVESNYETATTTTWEDEILDLDDFDEEFNL